MNTYSLCYDQVNVYELQGMFPYINQLADVYLDS